MCGFIIISLKVDYFYSDEFLFASYCLSCWDILRIDFVGAVLNSARICAAWGSTSSSSSSSSSSSASSTSSFYSSTKSSGLWRCSASSSASSGPLSSSKSSNFWSFGSIFCLLTWSLGSFEKFSVVSILSVSGSIISSSVSKSAAWSWAYSSESSGIGLALFVYCFIFSMLSSFLIFSA